MKDAEWEELEKRLEAAEGYYDLGMFDAALDELDALPTHYRNLPDTLEVRIGIHLAAKNWPTTLAIAEHLLTIEPENPQWWLICALATRHTRSIQSACAILYRAMELHPTEPLIPFAIASYLTEQQLHPEAMHHLHNAAQLTLHEQPLSQNQNSDPSPPAIP